MTTATHQSVDLIETSYSGSPYKVDRTSGVIHGVKVLGKISKNGREYSQRALESAARLYEGIAVNIDHPERTNPGKERGIRESFGELRKSTVRDDGVYADLHYLKTHALAEQVAEAAERFPDKIGMSHNAAGSEKRNGGKTIVEDVELVRSVDLVTRPATNKSLFESVDGGALKSLIEALPEDHKARSLLLEMDAAYPDMKFPQQMQPGMQPGMGGDLVKPAMPVIEALLTSGDVDKAKKIIDALFGSGGEGDPTEQPAGDGEGDGGSGKKPPFVKKKDTQESIEEQDEMALKELQEQVAKLTAERDEAKLRDKCRSMLTESKRDPSDKNVGILIQLKDDESRKSLIESWPEVRQVGNGRPLFSPPAQLTESTDDSLSFESNKQRAAFLRGR